MSNIYLSELRSLYRQGRLIPFIGAGVSMSVTWEEGGITKRGPSWRELVDEAARQLEFEEPDLLRVRGTDLQILEYFKLKQGNFAPLTNWLHREMYCPDDALQSSPIHNHLVQMEHCNLFYTTNYDDFLERRFALQGRKYKRIATEADIVSRLSGDDSVCEVVKFHGDLDHPEAMVISESHYERRLKLETAMDYRLRADVLGRALLFIGYGFRDWNVSYLFRLVNDQFKRLPNSDTGRRAYIIVSDPSEFERELFRDRNIGVIGISSKNQTEAVREVLAEIRG